MRAPFPTLVHAAALIPAAALALAGCASGRASLGSVTLRPYGDPGNSKTTFGVQEGRLVSPDLDLVVDPDGCVRGTLVHDMVQLCKQERARPPEKGGNVVERWSGTGGDVTVELMDGGHTMRADGYVRTGGGSLPLRTTVPLGQGPQWDELRKHPALLAIAAGAAGIQGEPDQDASSHAK